MIQDAPTATSWLPGARLLAVLHPPAKHQDPLDNKKLKKKKKKTHKKRLNKIL